MLLELGDQLAEFVRVKQAERDVVGRGARRDEVKQAGLVALHGVSPGHLVQDDVGQAGFARQVGQLVLGGPAHVGVDQQHPFAGRRHAQRKLAQRGGLALAGAGGQDHQGGGLPGAEREVQVGLQHTVGLALR